MNMQHDSLLAGAASLALRDRFALSPAVIPGALIAADVFAVLAAALACMIALPEMRPDTLGNYVFLIGFVTVAAALLMNRAGLYEMTAIMRPIQVSDCIVIAVATAFLLFLTIAFLLKVSEVYSRLWVLSFAITATVAVIAARLAICRLARHLSRRGVIGRTMVVLGTGEQGRRFLRRLAAVQPYFTSVAGVFSTDPRGASEALEGQPVLGGLRDLVTAARAGLVDDIVVALPWNADSEVAATVDRLRELPVNIYISTDLIGFELAFQPALGQFSRLPLFEVVQRPISGWNSLAKSVEDVVLSGIILIAIAPLLALIALAIKLDSPGPVLFRQKRLGFNNREFSIYKFRSMYHCEMPENCVRQAVKDDPRITWVGAILRRTSLDELPQLLNVLEGTMSLVGPRPHALSHNEEYGHQIRGYFARHNVKPGITGWAQVNGWRGETEELDKMEARVRHDIYYVEHWSIFFDLYILLRTVLVVLQQKNAY